MTFEPPSASLRTGGIIVAISALLSVLAFAFIVLRTIQLVIVLFKRDDSTSRPSETLLFRTQLGHYVGCLLVSNVYITVAGLIGFSWVSSSALSQGSTWCLAQAVLMQIGIWSTCWFTVALGVNNLNSFVFRIRQAHWHTLVVVTIGWTIALVAGLGPLRKGGVYGPTGPSCGFTRSYPQKILVLDALPIILSTVALIAIYSVISIILHREPRKLPSTRKLKLTTQRREDKSEQTHGFIKSIIWSMFWFPSAFMFLLLPFCITHILVYAGHSVPLAWNTFADVCVSMLGFVNVCLLCNTLRAISLVYCPRSDKAADTDKTFGNDASHESPISPQQDKFVSQPPVLSRGNGNRMYNFAQLSSNHSRDSSWASVERVSAGAKVAPRSSSCTTSSPWLGRQLSCGDRLRATSSGPRTPSLARDTKDKQCPSQSMADAPRKGARELTFKSKAPAALSIPHPPVSPHELSDRGIANKSAALAARLGIAAAFARNPSPASGVDPRDASVSVVPIPRVEVHPWDCEHADQPDSQLSPAFSVSLNSDYDSDELGEIMHVKSSSPVPESSNNEQVILSPFSTSPPDIHARNQRATVVSVWSQESRYTIGQPPDAEPPEAYPHLVANLLTPKVAQCNQADAGWVMRRPSPLGPRARPETSFKAVTKVSPRPSQISSTKSPSDEHPAVVIAHNNNMI